MLAGLVRPRFAAPAGALFAALAFAATLWGWSMGGGTVDLQWAPTYDIRFTVSLDGLAVLYALLATGIGFLVTVYASRYLPLHLEHQARPEEDGPSFFFFILLFMGSMVGLVMAQDLILIFVFWDLTAIASYYLIGYDRHELESRRSALMALLVTGITAVLFLIAALLLYAEYGTFALPELIEVSEPGTLLTVAAAFIAIAGLAKSAQIPFHFWLPRAMAAPTPVSAYLHSAAMVAAGVFLLGRFYPLIQKSDLLLDALLVIGLGSMAVGGILALTRNVLKQLLAYSTISQYGYVVFMFGLGGEYGAVAASFYVIAHALAKAALFLTAGAVTEATHGETRLSHLGGLRRDLPGLAVFSGFATAGLAALPLTIGFFKDELFFEAALERGSWFPVLAVAGAVLTFAYAWRFWSGVFLGERGREAHGVPWALTAPVAVLGVLVVVGGVLVGPFAALAEAAGKVTFNAPTPIDPAYHLDTRAPNLMALATWSLGVVVILSRGLWIGAANGIARFGERFGPEAFYRGTLKGLNTFSDRIHELEVRDLRTRVATILWPTGVLVGVGLLFTPTQGRYEVGVIGPLDWPLFLALILTAIAAIATVFPRKHLTMALVLSSVGYILAVVYAFFGGPDVAMVQILVETITALLFIGILVLLPKKVLEYEASLPIPRRRKVRDGILAVVAGCFAFAVAWSALSQPALEESVAREHLELAPEAHANDVVTAILADFRALDTIGEITVVGIALLGIATLLRRGRLW